MFGGPGDTNPPYLVLSSDAPRTYERVRLTTERGERQTSVFVDAYRADRNWNETLKRVRQVRILETLEEKVRVLANHLDLLNLPAGMSLADARSALSSAPDRILPVALDGAETGLHYGELYNLAQPQTNVSDWLIKTAAPDLAAGDYTFDLTVGGETRSVTVTVVQTGSGADTNQDLLAKIGRQIAAVDDRLTYEVSRTVYPDTEGVDQEWTWVSLTTTDDQWDLTFSLRDAAGDLVESLGLSREAPPRRSAALALDSSDQTSTYNWWYSAPDRLFLYLIEPTNGTEQIEVGEALDVLSGQVQGLLGEYNDLAVFLADHTGEITPSLLADLEQMQAEHLAALQAAGLVGQGSHELDVAPGFQDTLVARPEEAQAALVGEQGFFTDLRGILGDVLRRGAGAYATVSLGSGLYTSQARMKPLGRTTSLLNRLIAV